MPLAAIGFSGVGGRGRRDWRGGDRRQRRHGLQRQQKAVNAQTAAANTNNQLQRDLCESNKNLLNPYVQDGRDASSLLADFIGLSGDGRAKQRGA